MAEPRGLIRGLLLLWLALPLAPARALALPPAAAQAELARIDVVVTTARGRHHYAAELAATPEQQEYGLMFRTRMGAKQAMLFPFAPPRPATFWMANTVLPLDLVFIGADGRVLNVGRGIPQSRELVPSDGDAAAVLELNAGEAAKIGLATGDRVRYRLP